MRSRVVQSIAILFALVCFGGQALGQLGYISGTVVDPQGNPVEDVQIRIEGMEVSRSFRVETDEEGEFVHAGVPIRGIYRVIAEKEGYQGEYVEGVKPGFSRTDARSTIKLTLKPGEQRKFAFEMTDEELAELERRREEQRKQAEQMEKIRADFNQAVAMYNLGQYQEAADAFLKVIEIDAEQAPVWANLAQCYQQMESYEKSLEAWDKAITLDPEKASYVQSKGSIYAAMGDMEQAQQLYEKAAGMSSELDPEGAATNYYNMAVTFINSGKNEQAVEALNKALELKPDHAESHYQLGITLLGLDDMEGALNHLQQYVEIAPNGENAEVAKALIGQLGG